MRMGTVVLVSGAALSERPNRTADIYPGCLYAGRSLMLQHHYSTIERFLVADGYRFLCEGDGDASARW